MSYIERLAYDREAREELQRLLDEADDAGTLVAASLALDALLQWRDRLRAEHAATPRSQVAL